MKNFTLIAVIALLSFSNIQAQPQKSGWHDRMMSEKIAFITMELQLTPEEAQVFWPVYNQIAQEKKASQKAMMTAYRTMVKALEEGTASDKEISAMLDDYLGAKQAHKEAGKDDADRYRKVLPAKKVVKLYVAEENFRRHHIRNFKGGHKGPGTAGCPAQGGNGSGRPAQGQGGGKPGARR